MQFHGIHGLNIAVHDLEQWTRRFEEVFEMASKPVDESGFAFPGLRGASFDINGFHLNLIASDAESTSVSRFLERRGEGVFLVSVGVQDVDVATRELRDVGLAPVLEEPVRGEGHAGVTFTHPRDMAGVQLEFIEVPR
ncbi:VOC family protein [Actinomycetospora termitidis]|uniref:VOC family protein n=1 Tax=Actinomycetospora termitidis TaxID=3053470 RepID=A0ABT7M6W8_9PSEU|nr:VOC family protein [Actinomycetospora sp. Odt1-22]MDL5156191.1 VOC family protein [Actinomycetospora sp. Odt1-22]